MPTFRASAWRATARRGETESSISPPSARLESLFIADAMNTNANRTRPNVAVAPIVPARGTARTE